ncbi:MAG: addiction module protein [Planctomycetota bacterium]|nr:addiction module protein [Planctomycetota bacterium]
MPTYQSLLEDAKLLPVTERIQLIEELWDSVPLNSVPPLTEVWTKEIQRRSAELDAGAVQSIPWEQIKADSLARARLTKPNEND